jgi:hypothetical protein
MLAKFPNQVLGAMKSVHQSQVLGVLVHQPDPFVQQETSGLRSKAMGVARFSSTGSWLSTHVFPA